MVQLAANFDLRENPSVDMNIAQNLGNAIGGGMAAYKLAQQDKIRQTADAEFVRVLNTARQQGMNPEQTLSEIYKVPSYVNSRMAQEFSQRQEQYNQQNQLKDLQYQHQQDLQNIKAQNQYDLLNAKYTWLLENNLLTAEQKALYAQELEKLKQGGREDLVNQKGEIQSVLQGQKDEAAMDRTNANNQTRMDLQATKPNILTGGDGTKWTYDAATGKATKIEDVPAKPQTQVSGLDKEYSSVLNNLNKTVDFEGNVKPGFEDDNALWRMRAKQVREKMQSQSSTVQPSEPTYVPNELPQQYWNPLFKPKFQNEADPNGVQEQPQAATPAVTAPVSKLQSVMPKLDAETQQKVQAALQNGYSEDDIIQALGL